jgi:hypothetical protein
MVLLRQLLGQHLVTCDLPLLLLLLLLLQCH